MQNNYRYKQDQLVEFNVAVAAGEMLSGVGRIMGAATVEVAVLGVNYIVMPIKITGTVQVPNEEYPFTCIPMAEIFLTPYVIDEATIKLEFVQKFIYSLESQPSH